MSGRWVCPHCYESNEADAVQCARCSLARGADPTQAEPALEAGAPSSGLPWAPVAKQSQRSGWLQQLMRFGWVGVVVVIAVAGILFNAKRDDSGQLSGGGNLQIQDLRIGDCFNLKDETADTIGEVDAMPCGQAHRYELYHEANMSEGDYPAEAQLAAYAEQECVGAFLSYVGNIYENSTLEVLYFTPTSDAWRSGDRSVQCAAYDPANASITGSLKGARR